MIRVLAFVVFLAILAACGAWLADTPGELTASIAGYRIESTPAVGALAIVGFALAVLLLWTVLRFIFKLPSLVGSASSRRRQERGYAAVSRGMVAVGAGDQRGARRYADDAQKLLGSEPLALLLKAQAAQMAGDRTSAEGAFKQMLDEPETRVLGLRGLFVEARRKGDSAAARAYAAEAARLSPSVAWAGEAMLEYQCGARDWAAAMATLERGAKSLDKAVVRRQRAVLLTADALDRAEAQADAALTKAQEALKLAPGLVPAAALAGTLLGRRGDLRRASKLLEQAWTLSPHPDLAAAYIASRPGDAARERLARAEKLLWFKPSEPEGRIAVARAALAARSYTRAREVLQPLLAERPSVRVCLLMAELEEADGGSAGQVREWLARASRAPRDPAWIADGVLSDSWAPVSPVTGRIDAFVWGTPIESISGPEAPPPLPSSERIIADIDEAEAPDDHPPEPAASKTSAPAREDAAAPAEPAPIPEPGPRQAEPRAPAEPRREAERPHRANGETETAEILPPVPARPTLRTSGGEVVFPLSNAPDDPGPDGAASAQTRRHGFLN